MAETLIVVAIIVILTGVVVISVIDYLRSTTKLEYDGYAKSIFVAAQNHLTMAEHEGYLGRTKFGVVEDEGAGVYHFVVENGSGFDDAGSVQDLILPYGSVDETVRAGSYIIRYQKSPAQVLDVFYWSDEGRYAFYFNPDVDYSNMLDNRDDKDELRNYGGSVIGYYGGADEGKSLGEKLLAPQIQLINAEKLYVVVDNPNSVDISGMKLKLFVRGETSGHIKEIELTTSSQYYDSFSGKYTVILDDITSESKRHFSEVFCSIMEPEASRLIPGEDITVYAVVYNDEVFTNVAYSSEQTANSLFGDAVDTNDDDLKDTIGIANVRHLENLDSRISGFAMDGYASGLTANQTADLSWKDFTSNISAMNNSPLGAEEIKVYEIASSPAAAASHSKPGCYDPISPSYALTYDGAGHTIAEMKIDKDGAAGLFGNPTGEISVSNLRLLDFDVTGLSAGTLAGSLTGGTVRNVLACQSKGWDSTVGVTASGADGSSVGYAGGLVAETNGTVVEACAASVYVNSDGLGAGGLVGKVEGGAVIGSYAAGFTYGGAYYHEDTPIYNVTAANGTVGGLVAVDVGAQIDYSYSTASVSGQVAGGLVGNSDSGIHWSYSTGLVDGSSRQGSFAGVLSGSASDYTNNYYFSIINWGSNAVGQGVTGTGIRAFDDSTADYRYFVSTGAEGDPRSPARPYDDTLNAYYQGKYNLKTVDQLGTGEDVYTTEENDFVRTHYGDWPAPEILVVNE